MEDFSQPSTSRQTSQPHRSRTSNHTEDPADILSLKFNYIRLLDELSAIDGNSNVRQSVVQINQIIDKADELFSQVRNTPEMYLDAKVLSSTTESLEQTINNIDVGEGNFKLFTFAEQFKVKSLNSAGKPSWEVLAAAAAPVVHNSVPTWFPYTWSFEFIAEELPNQQKKVRRQHLKDQDTEKTQPEKLSQADKRRESAEEMVNRILVKLNRAFRDNKKRPINYFRFVINPNSFSATVENIFYVSFLVKDNHVKIELDDDEPVISPILKGKENSNPGSEHQTREIKQNIFSIDMRTWKELVAAMKITGALI